MSATGTTVLAEADMHGLVDGYINPERRAEVLRRLAASPADRSLVEAWQSQNDLLRSAFTSIVLEPLPAMLDVKARPKLQCVPSNNAPIVQFPTAPTRRPRKRAAGTAYAAFGVVVAGLLGSWLLLSETGDDFAGIRPREQTDVTLAALSHNAITQVPQAVRPRAADSLPTTDIPDLRPAGFSFLGAETRAAEPVSIVFRYQNGKAERVAVSVAARSPVGTTAATSLVRVGDAFSWSKGNKSFAIAGTVSSTKLRSLAAALQRDDTQ